MVGCCLSPGCKAALLAPAARAAWRARSLHMESCGISGTIIFFCTMQELNPAAHRQIKERLCKADDFMSYSDRLPILYILAQSMSMLIRDSSALSLALGAAFSGVYA